VTPGSPSADAGMMVGDVLVEFDGHSVGSPEDLLDLLVEERIGRTVPLSVMRGAAALDVKLVVGARPRG
jgi:serine protease Do